MSSYTKLNFFDLDDVVGDRVDGLEARFARSSSDAEQVGVSHFRYEPGVRPPVSHHHEVQEEVYVVIAGSGQARLDDEVIDLVQWDVLRVAPQVTRGFAAGPEGLEVIAVGGTRPEGGDGNISEDPWPEG
jgi:mannose-6-phosphate isomerase-like protein (cupin superfamily)